MYLYLDIETVKGEVPKPLLENILSGVKPDARARDKEASVYEKKEKILAEAALSPMLAQIVCVGWALNDDEPVANISDDEEALIQVFTRDLTKKIASLPAGNLTLVTYNGKSFDIPHLLVKFTKYGLHPPFPVTGSRYDTDRHRDVRMILSNYDQYARGTLEQWAAFYGYPEIREETGGDIQKLWDEKKEAEIAEKCKGDVDRTRYIHGFLEGIL